jgi:hypothetical protein
LNPCFFAVLLAFERTIVSHPALQSDHERDARPGTRRTLRGAAIQIAAAEMTQQAMASRKASR